jgi:hypothetical protein
MDMPNDSNHVKDIRDRYLPTIHRLFERAFETNPFEALCSVLRVGGMSDEGWDPFEESRKAFDDFNWLLDKSITERNGACSRRISLLMYCHAVEMTAVHEIIANCLRCLLNEQYIIDPFQHLSRKNKKKIFSYIPSSAKNKFKFIKELASKAKESQLGEDIDSFFDENIRNAFSHSDYIFSDDSFRFRGGRLACQMGFDELDKKITGCFGFYGAFMYLHRQWLKELTKTKKYHKWQRYQVLEILSSEKEGVYGFNVHFSNGSKSTYVRRASGIKAINLRFDKNGHIAYFCGDLDALEPVWKIDGNQVVDWDLLP